MLVKMSYADIPDSAKKMVNDVLDSGWISRRKYIPLFEQRVSQMHGGKYGIFMNSGTDALRIALLTLKETYRWQNGDTVIIPGLTFVASANAVLQAGLTPVFVDVQRETGNIEPSLIASRLTTTTRAILVVHLFGLPASMPAVMRVAKKHRLKVIEDSCETVGVHKLTGDMACFSFYQSHHVQCGVGGMIVTNSASYDRVARSYMNHGRIDDGSHFKFGRHGFSSRATEMEAALGLGSLKGFKKSLAKRKALAVSYIKNLEDNPFVEPTPYNSQHSWMFYPIRLLTNYYGTRDDLLKYLRAHGVESREAMPLVNQPCFAPMYRKRSCPNAEEWTERGLLLPLHPLMNANEVEYVCQTVERFF